VVLKPAVEHGVDTIIAGQNVAALGRKKLTNPDFAGIGSTGFSWREQRLQSCLHTNLG
jgi:hypothetical protein